jgi:pimeloyl-ACP methyl ester carboxylesterase
MLSRTTTDRDRRYTAGDGITLVGDIAGDAAAPTVVLLHGGGQTRYSWDATMTSLAAAGYHALRYDARGHGESDWSPDGVYTFDQRAHDLEQVLADVRGPFALVGASMGGITALQALGDGLRPAAIVLVDIVLRPERSGVERVRAFMHGSRDGFASLDEAAAAVTAYNPHRPPPADPAGLMRNLRLHADGRLRWHWDPRIVPDDLDEDIRMLEAIVARVVPANGVPVLLVRGRRSDILSDESVADFRTHFPHAEVQDVADAGHMVAGDSNDVFMQGVIGFLARHLPAAGHGPASTQ